MRKGETECGKKNDRDEVESKGIEMKLMIRSAMDENRIQSKDDEENAIERKQKSTKPNSRTELFLNELEILHAPNASSFYWHWLIP